MGFQVFFKAVFLALFFSTMYAYDMWSGLENDLVAYADDATLIAVVPSPDMRATVADSLNCDLAKINAWYTLCLSS